MTEEMGNEIRKFYHFLLKTKLKKCLDEALEIVQELGIEHNLGLKGIKTGAYNTYSIGAVLRSIGYNAGVYENPEWGSKE